MCLRVYGALPPWMNAQPAPTIVGGLFSIRTIGNNMRP